MTITPMTKEAAQEVFETYLRNGTTSPAAKIADGMDAPEYLTDMLVAKIRNKYPLISLTKADAIDCPRELYSMPAATQSLLDDGVADMSLWLVNEFVDVFVHQMAVQAPQLRCEKCGCKASDTYTGAYHYASPIRVLRDPYSAKPYVLFYSTFMVSGESS